MMYSAFMSLLRFLVLCGLCFNSTLFATVPTITGIQCNVLIGGVYSSWGVTSESCQNIAFSHYKERVAAGAIGSFPPRDVICNIFSPQTQGCSWAGQYGRNPVEVNYRSDTSCPPNSTLSGSDCVCNSSYVENSTRTACIVDSCPIGTVKTINDFFDTVNTDQSGATVIKAPATLPPPTSCYQGCTVNTGTPAVTHDGAVINYSISAKVTYSGTNTGAVCGTMPTTCNAPSIIYEGICKGVPTCTTPQVVNSATNSCVTPSCPLGQTRSTPNGVCSPIICVAPLVKVGVLCEIPSCPSGQSYQFKDGLGSCVSTTSSCTAPKTMINGTCQSPACSAGTSLLANGTCGISSGANATGGTSTVGPSTTTTTGTTTAIDSTGATTTTTSTTTSSITGGASGSGSGSGTCISPPCGACDPSVTTCGTTFGGSCKSDFQCSGDAVQCAVAKATNKAECDLQSLKIDTATDLAYTEGKTAFDSGTKALGTAGGLQVANGSNITIDSQNPYSSACPADLALFEYKGTNFTMPLSKYCNIFQIMGNILLLAASLIALKIIMKVD